MIISHEHKFIFLRTRKTGGTSVELALSDVCGPDDVITPLGADEVLRKRGPQNWRRHGWWQSRRPLLKRYWFRTSPADYGFYNHIPAKDARELLNDDRVWRSYFKFAFDRNPWDRQVSAYHFRYRHSNKPPPFSDYMLRKRRAWINNYEIYSIDGVPCIDFIGRFESLAEDFRKVLTEIGLTVDQELPRAKTSFRRDRRHYRDHYNPETREIVAHWYAREINLLGYKF